MKIVQRDLHRQAKAQSIATRDRIVELVRNLDAAQLAQRPEPKGWTIAEVLEHLCITDEILEAPARRAMAAARTDAAAPLREWKPSLLGGLIARALESPRKSRTPKAFNPPNPRGGVLEAFRQIDQAMVQMMDDAAQLDWRAIRVKSPAMPPIIPGYNLGDVFRNHALHTTRHAGQIERLIGKV